MSDRKYRQRGYQDEGKPSGPRGPKPPRPPQERAPGRQLQDERGPKTPNLMAAHEVFKCARCGNRLGLPVARVAPKDERNLCTLFAPRTTVERQTGTAATGESASPNSARQAFDDLFK